MKPIPNKDNSKLLLCDVIFDYEYILFSYFFSDGSHFSEHLYQHQAADEYDTYRRVTEHLQSSGLFPAKLTIEEQYERY